jgi:hypothetical protein
MLEKELFGVVLGRRKSPGWERRKQESSLR